MPVYYKCLAKKIYNIGNYTIEAVQPEHIEKIRQWRNEQMDFLRQAKPVSKEEQVHYYENNVYPEVEKNQPNKILLSIKFDKKLIGYGGLVNISWENLRGEISFLLDTKFANTSRDYAELFPEFLKLIQYISFDELSLCRIYGELFDIRPQYRKAFENNGFMLEGVLKAHSRLKGKPIDSLVYGLLYDDYKILSIVKNNNPNVLITSISKKVPLIQSVIKSTKKINPFIKVFGGDTDNSCIGKYFVDEFWEMPTIKNLSLENLISFCKQNNIGFIVPTRDGELKFFSEISDQLENNNIVCMISNKESIVTCLDKLKFAQLVGINIIPASENIEDIDAKRFVVKERFGAGAEKIGINIGKEDALTHGLQLENPIYQPFISGDEISVDAYVTLEGSVKGIVMRRRDLIVNGESQVTTTFNDDKLENKFKNILGSLNLYGHVLLQAIISNNDEICVIECNPRFGGASILSLKAGLDSFYWGYLEAMGSSIENNTFIKSQKEIKQVRHPHDSYL